MDRAVFDTNVLVAGFLSPAGPPGRIVEWLRVGSVVAVLDDRIFAEYAEVLVRPAFCLPAGELDRSSADSAVRPMDKNEISRDHPGTMEEGVIGSRIRNAYTCSLFKR